MTFTGAPEGSRGSGMNIANWAEENLAAFGEYEALLAGAQAWTNHQIHDFSSRLANALIDQGAAPGDRILLVLPSGFELFTAFIASLRAGAVPVVLHEAGTDLEIQQVAAHCAARGLVTGSVRISLLESLRDSIPLRIVTGPGDAATGGCVAFPRLLERYDPLPAPVLRAADDPAQVVYTSGTTGKPKAIVYTHGNIAARFPFQGPGAAARRPAPVRLMVVPPSHALGGSFFFLLLTSQGKIVCLDSFDPHAVLSAVQAHRVTTTILVPSMCEALIAAGGAGRYDLTSLRTVVVGGAAVSTSLVERFESSFNIRLSVTYGLTEVPGATLGLSSRTPGAVGRLAPGVEARIVDDRGLELPCGQVGQVQLKSPWTSFEGIAHAAQGDPWFATGDIGTLDENRRLSILGRSKEMINQGGTKIYPDEIVNVVAELGIRECAVVGVTSDFLGEEAVICVARQPGPVPAAEAILSHCRARLDVHRTPTSVLLFDDLPRNAVGKVDTGRLRQRVSERRAAIVETELVKRVREAPAKQRRSILHAAVHRILWRVLRREPEQAGGVAPDAGRPFGSLGLDSMGSVEFANALSVALGRPVAATVAFDHPTVDALSDHLLDEHFGGWSPALRTAVRGRRPASADPVAIVGMGCRLPGPGVTVEDPAQFWRQLHDGIDAVREIPRERWNADDYYDPRKGIPGKCYTREGAFIDAPDQFDAGFFGVTPKEAAAIDPQQRLLLEVCSEAISDAGHAPSTLAQLTTGVFLGVTGSSYPATHFLGVLPCMAPGRVSHFFDLHGPSVAIDTACSSSLVAVHAAMQSLRRGECDVALAGGVHVMASPRSFIGLCEIQALAADGRCKAFDESADGYGRGEGCAVVVLKPLSAALADRDRIVALIRGGATNHDGRSSSLTAPNGQAQRALLRAALDDAGVAAADVDYLEAHGTGTPLGDRIELDAAAAVLGSGRDGPLLVGSVKTNVGHLEAASGVVGLIKTALALDHGEIPPHLHFRRFNPLLESLAGSIAIPTERLAWRTRPGRRRIAGVTSLGFSGTNAHLVLEEAPPPPDTAPPAAGLRQRRLLCLSARTPPALDRLAERFARYLADARPPEFADVCYTANAGRPHFAYRMSLTARTAGDAARRLRAPAVPRAARRGHAGARPKVAFLFTGQGSERAGMARQLYREQPVFRRALHRCAEIVDRRLPRPLLDVLYGRGGAGGESGGSVAEAALAQPALFAIQWALSETWRSWGVEPDVVMGHSLGEYAAACAAGLFDLETALELVAERGRLTQTLPRNGAMLSVAAGESRIRPVVEPHLERVSIAAVNGANATVLSGHREAIAEIERALAAAGMAARPLDAAYAYHSPLVDPIMDAWADVLAGLDCARPHLPLVSSLTGELAGCDTLADPAYWSRHLRQPVLFAAALEALLAEGCGVFVELGPRPVLLALARRHLGKAGGRFAWLASLQEGRADTEQMLESLSELYVRGVDPDWDGVYRGQAHRRVAAPGYPFERESYWSTRIAAPGAGRGAGAAGAPSEPPPPVVRAAPGAPRILEDLPEMLGGVLGCDSGRLTPDANLIDEGLDSLRVTELLAELHRTFGLACDASDLLARPTLRALSDYLAGLAASEPASGDEASGLTAGAAANDDVPISEARAAAGGSPLVVLRERGGRPPVFCVHPAGGGVSAYLRLRSLLGDEQPLYAIQSRACKAHEREHASLDAMAVDYATLIQDARPGEPVGLLGWSMGGAVCHAVARELERRGEVVNLVGMIDSRPPARVGAGGLPVAVLAVMHELSDAPPETEVVLPRLARLEAEPVDIGELLDWCEREGLWPAGSIADDAFTNTVQLYLRHFQLMSSYAPGVIQAPLALWWAGSVSETQYWSRTTRGGVREQVVGGTHFTIVRPPLVDAIAAGWSDMVKGGECV